MSTQIQLRHDTAANWTTVNPILAIGEKGVETDTGFEKTGDGGTAWNSLPYSLRTATTSVAGVVQLTDSTASTSTTTAATPNAVKSAYDLANGKVSQTNGVVNAPFEKLNIVASAATGTINLETGADGSVWYYTTSASGNFTINVRTSNTIALNTTLAIGESVTVVLLNTNGATAYYANGFQIDGNAVTPKWQGGTAPTSGNESAIDAYTYVIVKTASATFTVLASQVKYA